MSPLAFFSRRAHPGQRHHDVDEPGHYLQLPSCLDADGWPLEAPGHFKCSSAVLASDPITTQMAMGLEDVLTYRVLDSFSTGQDFPFPSPPGKATANSATPEVSASRLKAQLLFRDCRYQGNDTLYHTD